MTRRELQRAIAAPALLALLGALGWPLPSDAGELPSGRLVEAVACRNDPTQTYTLYLPSGYSTTRRWPALLIFDPRGRSSMAAEIFQSAAEEFGWLVLSSDNTRSDGPWEPNAKALAAMWPEIKERWSVDPRRVYAAGFSGGAIVALALAETTGGIAGIIASGGRYPDAMRITRTDYAHFGSAGLTDFNYREMWKLDKFFAKQGNPHRMEPFSGRHQWLPPELARLAIGWLEIEAMQQGTRPRDPEIIEQQYRRELEEAASLESDGRLLEALWRYETIARTFGDLRELAEVEAGIERISADPALDRERKERRRWDAWEERYWQEIARARASRNDQADNLSQPPLFSSSSIKQLKKRAADPTYEATVAQRILEQIWTQTSFYMARDLLNRKRYRAAVDALTIAVEIRDDSQYAWYNLACAAARSGARKRALEALGRAVELGFRDVDHINSDEDLEALRDEPEYQALIEDLRSRQ